MDNQNTPQANKDVKESQDELDPADLASQPSMPRILEEKFPATNWVPTHADSSNPLQFALLKIQRHMQLCTDKYNSKKLQLLSEFEQEKDIIRRKYEALIQETEMPHLRSVDAISSRDEDSPPREN
ncbi:hypothetical protein M5K25_013470 [Dendrobium thyrsiflorum]|uniref:Uncharacterized protein n=1 Tax=Dendrobium thyrsiflorum TaxID=117978 RepID=A0ABD0UU57_DENTH